jgi:tetratricopeptide (TPR) repeat protein
MGGERVMAISVLLSTVSDEFRAYRDQLVHDLTRHNVAVKVQEDFKDLGGNMLDKLDAYIAHCDAVVHLVGDMCGYSADETQQRALLAKHSDLQTKLPPLGEALANCTFIPYTQWEAWLTLYHGKSLLIAKAKPNAPRGPKYAPTDASRAAQAEHLDRLKAFHRYPGSEFGSPDELAKQIAYTVILDLLVEDYAKKTAQERDVAKGFIEEMAKRVAGDKALDLDGMKQAVRNAIEIYEKEIAGRRAETNLNDVVSRALSRAKEQVDRGQSGLARATLRKAAEETRREEEERRERYIAGVTALYTQARDISLAAYDGDSASEAILELARTIHGANAPRIVNFLGSEALSLCAYGRAHGSNVHLVAAIALRRGQLSLVASADERGAALNGLGVALEELGERESETEKLKQAVSAFHKALNERTRARAPLDWAMTQTNLGNALLRLGERESGTARLEQAVRAHRAALDEYTREAAPLEWAATQNNLGAALAALGRRQSGTKKLEEAVAAFKAALEERTRERVPLDWVSTQTNLGGAFQALGEREGGTTQLEAAVVAHRAALEEWTRERVPLLWAAAEGNVGNALATLGKRKSETDKLEGAVKAYRAALEEQTRERVPLDWAMTQSNLGGALQLLGDQEDGPERLEEAVEAYRAALQELSRERTPPQWTMTQNNLGNALFNLGRRERGTGRLEEATEAYRAALTGVKLAPDSFGHQFPQQNLDVANALLIQRREGTDVCPNTNST